MTEKKGYSVSESESEARCTRTKHGPDDRDETGLQRKRQRQGQTDLEAGVEAVPPSAGGGPPRDPRPLRDREPETTTRGGLGTGVPVVGGGVA